MNQEVSQVLAGSTAESASTTHVWRRVLAIALAAVLTAVAAKVAVPLPGIPVPFTLQPVAVLLAGALLGASGGFKSQSIYLAAGMVGLPVFAAGGGWAYLLGPTGGYLLAFPVAAWLAGAFSDRSRSAPSIALGAVVGLAVIHLGGIAWLAAMSGREAAAAVGLAPFFVGDLLKVALVTLIGAGFGGRARRWIG
jgi:biotin transport system substrate-specific component